MRIETEQLLMRNFVEEDINDVYSYMSSEQTMYFIENPYTIEQVLVEWGGEKFSQEPSRFTNNSRLFFKEYKDKEYYKRFLGNHYPNDIFIALHLERTLLDLERLINNKGKFWSEEIILFLDELFKLESFVILLIREEEYIDEKYQISDKEELHHIICNSLNWNNPKGVLITYYLSETD